MTKRVLVVGASRGLGLGLVDRHLVDGWEVAGTTRDGAAPRPGVETYRLDVTDQAQLDALVDQVVEPFDRVIHNAGIMNDDADEMIRVNTEAPIRVVQRLLDEGLVAAGGRIAIMTSQMGARRGRAGKLGGYGESKALLNDEFRRRADRWSTSGIVAVVMHPGWVRTAMGGAGASISVAESARGITDFLDAAGLEHHGGFWTWDGRSHAW